MSVSVGLAQGKSNADVSLVTVSKFFEYCQQ